MVASSYSVQEGMLATDTEGLVPLRVMTITTRGILLANQAEASFTIALGSQDARSLAEAIIKYAESVPSTTEQVGAL